MLTTFFATACDTIIALVRHDQIGQEVGCMLRHAQFEQILPILYFELLAVELDGLGGEVRVEKVRAQVAGEVILGQAEWIDDTWQDRLLQRLTAGLKS